MIENLPKYDVSLHITHNGHKDYYEDLRTYLKRGLSAGLDGFDPTEWVSRDDFEAALNNDSLWEVQWYPDTPGAFYRTKGSTLESALLKANEVTA